MHFPDSAYSSSLYESNPALRIEDAVRPDGGLQIASDAVARPENESVDAAIVDAPFLIFRLGGSIFGVPALAVRTIHTLPALSPLQETPAFIAGVFNLHGAIVPVMDLNARFGRQAPTYRLDDSLIVLNWGGSEVAIIVNEVRAVGRIPPAQIEAAPAHGRRHDLAAPFVAGVAQISDGIVMLLHLPHLLQEATPLSAAPGAPLPGTPLPGTEETAASRFHSQQWTEVERAVLEERAARLRFTTDAHGADAQSIGEQVPVAVVALGGEEFGVEVNVVREFASVSAVTRVPCSPPHILGQINLRGDIVTLVDVRQKLRTMRTEPAFFQTQSTTSAQNARQTVAGAVPVVVVQHEGAPIGIAVDELRGVLYLRDDERQALEVHAQSGNEKYFAAAALHEGRLLPLLDVARLFDEGGLTVEESV